MESNRAGFCHVRADDHTQPAIGYERSWGYLF